MVLGCGKLSRLLFRAGAPFPYWLCNPRGSCFFYPTETGPSNGRAKAVIFKRRLTMRTVNVSKIPFIIVLLVLLTACAGKEVAEVQQEERRDILYICNCGPQCNCNTVSTKPGNCACGAPLKWGHVIKVEGNEAILCQCKEGCACDLAQKDLSRCGCGMAVKRVSLEGTGIYFCNCGGSCYCNTVSDQPGRCRCGMNLKKAG